MPKHPEIGWHARRNVPAIKRPEIFISASRKSRQSPSLKRANILIQDMGRCIIATYSRPSLNLSQTWQMCGKFANFSSASLESWSKHENNCSKSFITRLSLCASSPRKSVVQENLFIFSSVPRCPDFIGSGSMGVIGANPYGRRSCVKFMRVSPYFQGRFVLLLF